MSLSDERLSAIQPILLALLRKMKRKLLPTDCKKAWIVLTKAAYPTAFERGVPMDPDRSTNEIAVRILQNM